MRNPDKRFLSGMAAMMALTGKVPFMFGSGSLESRRAVHRRLAKLRASVRDDDARIAAAAEERRRELDRIFAVEVTV